MRNFYCLLLCIAMASCATHESADIIIQNGIIHTVNDRQPTAEAVAIKGDKILFVGSAEEIEKFNGENTQVIDLDGKTMTPGFIEGHGHFMGLGESELNLNLMNVKNFDEIVAMVKEAAGKSKPGEWIIGRGWHQDKWDTKPDMIQGFPTNEALSKVSPDNPVYLTHASGHAAMVNAKALELAGLNVLSKEKSANESVAGGEIVRDEHGNPTGILNERAQSLVATYIPKDSKDRMERVAQLAIDACLKNGITSFHDAGEGQETIDLYYAFKAQGKLGVRLYVMLSGSDRPLIKAWAAKGPEIDSTHWLTIRSIKLYSDGALGSRGAWLLEPYSDMPNVSGMSTQSLDSILSTSRLGLASGFQVCTHAIGDRANREVLNQYETALDEFNGDKTNHRFRIEHAQHIDPADIPRFGKLGVIPAMQAIHMSSDRPWAINRLGEKRIQEGAYMWQSLLKSGAKIVNGTDVPVEPINPLACFYASVTRKTLKGEPEGGYEPSEKMTREQALRSYTLDAAYGAFEENIKGSIEVGKLADFTIFTRDIMEIDEHDILSTKVAMTIVGGKVVYQIE